MWMESGGKHPGSSGFDSRRAHPLRVCSIASQSGRFRGRPTLLVLRCDSRRAHPRSHPTSSRAGSGPLTHYCVVRRDLPRGVLAAQLIHAAGESAGGRLPAQTRAIALAARDEAHLRVIEGELLRLGIRHVAIREPDAPWHGALMAIGLAPITERKQVAAVTGGLPLLR